MENSFEAHGAWHNLARLSALTCVDSPVARSRHRTARHRTGPSRPDFVWLSVSAVHPFCCVGLLSFDPVLCPLVPEPA